MNLECIPCFQRQAINAARMATDDPREQAKVLKRVVTALLEEPWDQNPPLLAQRVHGIVREELGPDPYSKAKRESNDMALAAYTLMKDMVSRSSDPLQAAVRIAIAGNVIDFGPADSFDFEGALEGCLFSDMPIDQCDAFKERCRDSSRILYILDNAGEIVCDRILIESIVDAYGEKEITLAVKGGYILNDATNEDVEYVGLDKLPYIDVVKVSNGERYTGIPRESDCFRALMDTFDMIISKGQGNYEMLSHYEDIYFLLKAKCGLIARDLGVPVGSMVCGKNSKVQ
ncbi:MAG: DUF89 family protein [Candidatus Methanofastidiosa archaeon]|nr:DUF89 family protein [Candidatus Methanofastidiosa archaeon]